jgi:hypothetical protein
VRLERAGPVRHVAQKPDRLVGLAEGRKDGREVDLGVGQAGGGAQGLGRLGAGLGEAVHGAQASRQVASRDGEARIQRDGVGAGLGSLGEALHEPAGVPQVAPGLGVPRVALQRAEEQIRSLRQPSDLAAEHAQTFQGLGAGRVAPERREIQVRGLRQAALTVRAPRRSQELVHRCWYRFAGAAAGPSRVQISDENPTIVPGARAEERGTYGGLSPP